MKHIPLLVTSIIITLLAVLFWNQDLFFNTPTQSKSIANPVESIQSSEKTLSSPDTNISQKEIIYTHKKTLEINTNDKLSTSKNTQQEVSEEEIIKKEESLYEDDSELTLSENSSKNSDIHTTKILLPATEVKMKIKAKEKNGMVNAKISITHDMLTYDQAKKKGLEANFITHISATANDRVVYDASTSQFLSKDPLIKFQFRGKKSEILKIIYTDLNGNHFFDIKKIK